ncbi:MAG: universal stress protein [Bacillota bacterium]
MYKKILVPTDGSPKSDLAVQEGVRLAKALDSEIVVFHVVPEIPAILTPYAGRMGESVRGIVEELEASGAEILKNVEVKYGNGGLKLQTRISRGDAATEICNEAREGRYDLIVIGSRGLGEIKGFLLGSVSGRVVRHAGCSVLIIR